MDFVLPDLWVPAVGAIIPVVTGFITKAEAGGGLKALVALVLSVLVGALNSVVADGGGNIEELLSGGTVAFLTQISAYKGFWSPAVNLKRVTAPGVGLGSAAPVVSSPVS